MKPREDSAPPLGPWISLWVVALVSFTAQIWLCQFFSFGETLPLSLDVNPSNLWKLGYHFPPTGTFETLNWLGVAYLPLPLNPLSLAAHLPPWIFFTTYAPFMATLALLAMAAFLRELELSRPAALFGGIIYAWQGDILPFVYPGHFGYITMWPFLAIAAWGALCAQRTERWPYAVLSGVCCGIMVGLLTNADRGGIASLMIAALFIAPVFRRQTALSSRPFKHLGICVGVAALIALAPLCALYKGNIAAVKLAGLSNREQTYMLVTQFSLAPSETLTYLVPGFFGWHVNSPDGPYWGWIGEWPDWPRNHQGTRNLNLAISTTGTIATSLALMGLLLLLPGNWMGASRFSARTRFFVTTLLVLGFVALVLSWGWHTPFYRPLFALPLMDKWRNPLKWVEVTNFALVALSAMGAQHLIHSLDANAPEVSTIRRRISWFTFGLFAVLTGGFLASYPLALVYAPTFPSSSFEPRAVAAMVATLHTALLFAAVLVALFGLALFALYRPEVLRQAKWPNPWLDRFWRTTFRADLLPLTLVLTVAALAVAQLGWVATQFLDPWPNQALTATNPLLDALRNDTNENHVRVTVANEDQTLNTLLQNQFAAMNISCLDISAASRIPDDLDTFFRILGDDKARLWFLAGVKDVALPQEMVAQMRQDPAVFANIARADGYTIASTSSPDVPSHSIVTLKDYLAKATFVPGSEILSSEDILKRLKDPTWKPRATILLEKSAAGFTAKPGGMPDATAAVRLRSYTPTQIVLDAQTPRGGFVLINDHYDQDWHVQVNGVDQPLLSADYLLRAVAIPSGASEVTMKYVAHYFGSRVPAVLVSLFSDGVMLAALLVVGFGLRRRS